MYYRRNPYDRYFYNNYHRLYDNDYYYRQQIINSQIATNNQQIYNVGYMAGVVQSNNTNQFSNRHNLYF